MIDLLRKLELPPVWLVAFMAAGWWLARELPLLSFESAASLWIGRALIAAGLGLMIWSAVHFRRAKTSIIPRETASALVTGGPYRFSRNPIYLGDLIILFGWGISLGALSPLLIAPLFVPVINARFIKGEEAMLRREFPDAFAEWSATVRRWI